MNFLPVALAILFFLNAKNKGGSSSFSGETLLSLLKTLTAVKESGVGDVLREKNPLQALLSGKISPEKLAPVFSAVSGFAAGRGEEKKNPSPEVPGEEFNLCLERLLNAAAT